MKQKKKENNVVRIGKNNSIEIYEHAILMRMSPRIYDNFNCIIIQVVESRVEYADLIINRFKYAGLKEIERKKKPVKTVSRTGESYTLPDAYEIKLRKIPVLEMQKSEEEVN